MKGLAEYVMRGRMQALLVAVVSASTLLFAWISAAVIALVTLRRGWSEGVFVLLWAALPASYALFRFGDLGSLAMLAGTAVLAVVLRLTISWSQALVASVAVGAVTGYTMLLFGMAFLEQLVTMFAEVFENLQARLPEGQLVAPGVNTLAGMMGLMNSITCVMCLLLARYWQASLYNPGGFREEFHGLRLGPQLSTALGLGLLGVSLLGVEYRPWALLLAVPLSVAGLAFIHARAARRGLGFGWLSLFYVLWLVLDPVKLIVIGVAVADSFIDFRGRWRKADHDQNDEET